jgi:DNA polymerase-3 subunit chi
MVTISFYHLHTLPLDKALPKLLEKVVTSNKRAIVRTASDTQMEALNKALWTYTTKFFLPHGSKNDPRKERQPVYLTSDNENPNGATVLALVGGVAADFSDPVTAGFEKYLDMFDGTNEAELQAARGRWSAYKAAGHSLVYWKQNAKGAWEEGARA